MTSTSVHPRPQGTCPHCNTTDLFTQQQAQHLGLYFSTCGRWRRWFPQNRPILRRPFGVIRGRLIEDLPQPYLDWVLEKVKLKGSLFKALSDEFERRRSRAA